MKLWHKISVALIAAGLLIFLVLSTNLLSTEHYVFIMKAREAMFSRLSIFGTFFSEIKKGSALIRENLALKEENQKLLAELAVQAELKEQNDFLRKTIGLEPLRGYRVTDAKTYNLQFTPEGHYLLINKGEKDGIKNGDIVITSSGVLIGQVSNINTYSSHVRAITDPNLKTTVKLLANSTSAIARGILDNGLQLDFVSQNDEIKENDMIVTSGNDLFPAGLIVGTISKITSNDSSLFKKVEARAEFKNINISRVLVLSQ